MPRLHLPIDQYTMPVRCPNHAFPCRLRMKTMRSSYGFTGIVAFTILLMPWLHLPWSSYDLFVYGFPYDFFGIVGGYKLRRKCLHCLRSPCNFFWRKTRTKPYRDLADIVRQPQGCRAVIVLSSRPPYINRTMPVR